MVLIFGVRELKWPLLKLINSLKILDMRYEKGKHCKSFPWTYNLMVINGIIIGGGIVMGKDY